MILCAAEAPQRKKKKKRRRAPRIVFPDPDRNRKPAKIHVYTFPSESENWVPSNTHGWEYFGQIWKAQCRLMHDRLHEEALDRLEPHTPWLKACRAAGAARRAAERTVAAGAARRAAERAVSATA